MKNILCIFTRIFSKKKKEKYKYISPELYCKNPECKSLNIFYDVKKEGKKKVVYQRCNECQFETKLEKMKPKGIITTYTSIKVNKKNKRMTLKSKIKSVVKKAKKTAYSAKRKINEANMKSFIPMANASNKMYGPTMDKVKSKIRKMKKKK